MASLKQLKTQFLEYTEIEKGRSILTVGNYDRYIGRFIEHTKITNPEDITAEVVREYRDAGAGPFDVVITNQHGEVKRNEEGHREGEQHDHRRQRAAGKSVLAHPRNVW